MKRKVNTCFSLLLNPAHIFFSSSSDILHQTSWFTNVGYFVKSLTESLLKFYFTFFDVNLESGISIIYVIQVLTGNERPRKYWGDLKRKLKKEESQLSDFFGQLKMQSSDGKFYKTDVADVEQLFRLIKSIEVRKGLEPMAH